MAEQPAQPSVSNSAALRAVAQTCQALRAWLLDDAFDRWWEHGADRARGGFHERLDQQSAPLDEPRRSRVNPRQVYCYSLAEDLGWHGPSECAVLHGIDYFLKHYRRPDRLFRGLVNPDGSVVTDEAVLYDQAFALLGLACAYETTSRDEYRDQARELLGILRARFGHPQAGFNERQPSVLPLSSNSHMHMLEVCLAWMDLDHDPMWSQLANEIVELALSRFFDPATGFLLEFFDAEWRPIAGEEGRLVEPGHQYEWAWLLLRWSMRSPTAPSAANARAAAIRLVDLAERHGVDPARGVAMNSLRADASVRDPQARLWPQTERIKATCALAELTGDARYWIAANEAALALTKYLATPVRGLWYDKLTADGQFIDEPAPASSFYHIVCAIAELEHAIKRAMPHDAQ